jgi:hypothetical protein
VGEWKLCDASGVVRRELEETEAKFLVDNNLNMGNSDVYALGPNDERYHELPE